MSLTSFSESLTPQLTPSEVVLTSHSLSLSKLTRAAFTTVRSLPIRSISSAFTLHLQFNQQVNVVFDLSQVLDPTFVTPTCSIFDNVPLQIWDVVGMDVFDRLNFQRLVVVPCNLNIKGTH